MAATTSELLWIVQLLHELSIPVENPSLIYCDNEAALPITENPIFHELTKHIKLDCHFVREHVTRATVKLMPIRTHLLLADVFTKALLASSFVLLMTKMGVVDFFLPS